MQAVGKILKIFTMQIIRRKYMVLRMEEIFHHIFFL